MLRLDVCNAVAVILFTLNFLVVSVAQVVRSSAIELITVPDMLPSVSEAARVPLEELTSKLKEARSGLEQVLEKPRAPLHLLPFPTNALCPLHTIRLCNSNCANTGCEQAFIHFARCPSGRWTGKSRGMTSSK